MTTPNPDEPRDVPERPFFCESCQNQFGMGRQAELEDCTRLPVCELCWLQMPVSCRLKIAADHRHNAVILRAIDTAKGWLELFQKLLERHDGENSETTGGSEDWLN